MRGSTLTQRKPFDPEKLDGMFSLHFDVTLKILQLKQRMDERSVSMDIPQFFKSARTFGSMDKVT